MSYPSQVLMTDVPLFMTQGYIMNVMQKLGHHPIRATINKDKKVSDKAVCIIQFANVDVAKEAVVQLNGKSVSMSGSSSTTFKLSQCTVDDCKLFSVMISDMGPEVDDVRLFKFAESFKSLCDAKVIVDKDGKSQGFGFLTFTSEDDQKLCIKIMNNSLELGKRPIKVTPAVTAPVNPGPVDLYALKIMSGDPWCRYTSWNQFIEPAEYPFIAVKVNLTACKENKDEKDVTNTSDSLVKYNVTSNTNYLNHETLERDCHLWDALECSKWLPLMALNLPPSDYADPRPELEMTAATKKAESNRNLSNGTSMNDSGAKETSEDSKKNLKRSNVPSKSLTSKPPKVMKKTNGIATGDNSNEDSSELPEDGDGAKKPVMVDLTSSDESEWTKKYGFDAIANDVNHTSAEDLLDLFPSHAPLPLLAPDAKRLSQEMFWHLRLGHMSELPLKAFCKLNDGVKTAVAFENAVEECEVCKLAKVPDRSSKRNRDTSKKPLECVHLHVIGPVQPVSKADGKRYVAIFVDEFSRVTMAYVMKHKSEIGDKFELFLKNTRKELGRKAEVRYVRMYDKMDFSGDHMKTVLDRELVSLQQTPSDIPPLARDFAKVLQERVRSMMFDSRLPKRMWDLAVALVVYAHNRLPLDALGFEIPYEKFSARKIEDAYFFHRFGCVAYVKVKNSVANKEAEDIPGETPVTLEIPGATPAEDGPPEAADPKVEEKSNGEEDDDDEEEEGVKVIKERKYRTLRCIFVGYVNSGTLFFHPESNLFTVSENARINDRVVYGDIYTKSPVKDVVVESVDAEWFKSLCTEDESSSSRRDDYYRSSSKRRSRFH